MLDHHQFRIIWLGSSGADPAFGQGRGCENNGKQRLIAANGSFQAKVKYI